MEELKFQKGEVVYREGDDSDRVFFVQAGEIDVVKRNEGKEIPLSILCRGEIFGEVGVLRSKPRSTTTRARGDLTLLAMEAREFLDAFGDNTLALKVVRMLCDRLAQVDEALMQRWAPAETVREGGFKRIRLLPGTDQVARQIGSDGVVIAKLPFRVGRQPQATMPPKATQNELLLQAAERYQLSLQHFVVEMADDALVVTDLDSNLGTVVNGIRVSRYEHTLSAGLRLGKNTIVAGGIDSPFRFTIEVQ